jgi:hypothetical protein
MKKITAFLFVVLLFCSSFKPVSGESASSHSDALSTGCRHMALQEDVQAKVLKKLKALNQYYATNRDYEVDVKHLLFSSVEAPVIEEKYNGFYKSRDGMEHSLLLGVETVQNREIRVSIDTNSHIVSISDIQKSSPFSIAELERSLKVCKDIRLLEYDSMDIVSLEFDVNKYPLSKLNIAISKNRISSIDMYHTEKMDNNNGENVYPHTRVEYSNYVENAKTKKKGFDVSMIVVKSGNTYKLTNTYKHFRMYDLRVKK